MEIIMKAYKFVDQDVVQSFKYYGTDKVIYTDDSDFLEQFYFTSNLAYLDNICEYISDEYCLDLEIDQTIVSLCDNDNFPIIVDFANKSFFLFDKKWQEQWNKRQVPLEESLLYQFLKFDLKSIYAPLLIATNSTYIKPIALILLNKYKDIEGISYIIYNFYDWASVIIGMHSTIRDKNILTVRLLNKSKNILSLPFSNSFISIFYEIYNEKNINYSSSIKNKYYGYFYSQRFNVIMKLKLD